MPAVPAQSLRWQQGSPRASWGLGRAYYALGDEEAAVTEWQRSENALSRRLAWSDAAFKRGDYAQALEQALLAQRVDPKSSSVRYRLGEAHRALGQLDEALEEYERAKRFNSFHPADPSDLASCYFGQARVYEAKKNWEAAIWHYEAGLAVPYAKGRVQVWLKYDRKLSAEEGEAASQKICAQLGGDCDASHWDSFGYLAGFELESFPVRLVAHGGEVFSAASNF